MEEGGDCCKNHTHKTLHYLRLHPLQELVPDRGLRASMDQGLDRGQVGVDPRQGAREETVQSFDHSTKKQMFSATIISCAY